MKLQGINILTSQKRVHIIERFKNCLACSTKTVASYIVAIAIALNKLSNDMSFGDLLSLEPKVSFELI